MNLTQLRAAKNAAHKSYIHLGRANAPIELRRAARKNWLTLHNIYKEEVRTRRYGNG